MLGADSRPKQLNRQQVMQLLNVIESLAMSSEVWFDGSIQDEDKAILKNHNNLFNQCLQLKKHIHQYPVKKIHTHFSLFFYHKNLV